MKTNKEYQALGHEIETAQADIASVEEKVSSGWWKRTALRPTSRRLKSPSPLTRSRLTPKRKSWPRNSPSPSLSHARDRGAYRAGEGIGAAPGGAVRTGRESTQGHRSDDCDPRRNWSVCHRLRPQVFQQVRTDHQIIQCDSYRRIIYDVPPPPPIEQPVVRTGPAEPGPGNAASLFETLSSAHRRAPSPTSTGYEVIPVPRRSAPTSRCRTAPPSRSRDSSRTARTTSPRTTGCSPHFAGRSSTTSPHCISAPTRNCWSSR